jgi:hypothetical protein
VTDTELACIELRYYIVDIKYYLAAGQAWYECCDYLKIGDGVYMNYSIAML